MGMETRNLKNRTIMKYDIVDYISSERSSLNKNVLRERIQVKG